MRDFRELRKEIENFKGKILEYNPEFIRRRKWIYKTFFNGEEDQLEYPLDVEQIYAIIKDDKHNLVVAAAGSGKTSVIAARIAYLTRRKDAVKSNRILAISFTRVAG